MRYLIWELQEGIPGVVSTNGEESILADINSLNRIIERGIVFNVAVKILQQTDLVGGAALKRFFKCLLWIVAIRFDNKLKRSENISVQSHFA